MEYANTAEQLELRARARALADEIMVHEQACEEHNGLPPEVHAEVSELAMIPSTGGCFEVGGPQINLAELIGLG